MVVAASSPTHEEAPGRQARPPGAMQRKVMCRMSEHIKPLEPGTVQLQMVSQYSANMIRDRKALQRSTDARKSAMVVAREAGASDERIAQAAGVSKARVGQILGGAL